jgi:LysR family transcriptional regulator, benzoate and cis,cis-muconate-responsive activator of ben and cat genes
MELRQLRYFLAVAEELSFSRAAKRTCVSQPPLSRQIANLEAELGARLFDRNKHSVSLTETGKVFYAEVVKSLAAVNRAVQMAQSAAKGKTGSLTFGFGGSAAYTLAPPLLRQFRRNFPGVELQLQSVTIAKQLEALRKEVIDVGFVIAPLGDDTIAEEIIARDPLMVALPLGHPLATQRSVSLKSLEAYGFVTLPGSTTFDLFTSHTQQCGKIGFLPLIVQQAETMEVLLGLVAAGIGISIVPSVARRSRITDVEYRPIDDPAAFVEFAIAWRKQNRSPVLKEFVQLIRNNKQKALLPTKFLREPMSPTVEPPVAVRLRGRSNGAAAAKTSAFA